MAVDLVSSRIEIKINDAMTSTLIPDLNKL